MCNIALLPWMSPTVLTGLQLSALLMPHHRRLCAAEHLLAAKTVFRCTAPVGGQLTQQPSAFHLTFTMLSIAGIPPLAGFTVRLIFFFVAMSRGQLL